MKEKKLVQLCQEGNKQSLETLIKPIQPLVFNLSLRFLWNREDAEDATQEILIKIISNLHKYDGRSQFKTWAYRVATNYLINLTKTKIETVLTSFEVFSNDLSNSKDLIEYNQPDKNLLEKELKIGCTLAMIQCLDRDLRITFILGGILKIKSQVGSTITNSTPENFRKRLALSRKILASFLDGNCGVYNPNNKCRCNKRISSALSCGKIDKNNLSFSNKIERYNNEMEELHSLAGIYNNHGVFKSEKSIIEELNQLISSTNIMNDL